MNGSPTPLVALGRSLPTTSNFFLMVSIASVVFNCVVLYVEIIIKRVNRHRSLHTSCAKTAHIDYGGSPHERATSYRSNPTSEPVITL